MELEKRTKKALTQAMIIIDWECDCYDWGSDEYEALMEILATIEDLLRSA